jgi:3-oxoacyl-[acyl-carrier protein] reductase
MLKLTEKVAVVTGASKGIGAAIAEKLAEEGAAVVVNYATSDTGAQDVVSKIRSKGGRAVAVQADVSKLTDIKRLFESAEREFGRIDLVVNNAGTYEGRPIVSVDEDHFDRHFDLNVKGLFFATQAAVSAFGERGGSIINISSIAASSPVPNLSVYSATKAAVDAFTKSLAAELGPKQILVNSVLPGATDTPGTTAMAGSAESRPHLVSQTPLGRIGQPRDIANVVAFLASDDAAWITGQLIPVSGGLHF